MTHVVRIVLFLSVDMASGDLFDIVAVQECHHASIECILENDFYKRESLSIGCCRGGDGATFGVFPLSCRRVCPSRLSTSRRGMW